MATTAKNPFAGLSVTVDNLYVVEVSTGLQTVDLPQ